MINVKGGKNNEDLEKTKENLKLKLEKIKPTKKDFRTKFFVVFTTFKETLIFESLLSSSEFIAGLPNEFENYFISVQEVSFNGSYYFFKDNYLTSNLDEAVDYIAAEFTKSKLEWSLKNNESLKIDIKSLFKDFAYNVKTYKVSILEKSTDPIFLYEVFSTTHKQNSLMFIELIDFLLKENLPGLNKLELFYYKMKFQWLKFLFC